MLLPSYNVIAPEANNTKQIMLLLHMKFGDISIKYVIIIILYSKSNTAYRYINTNYKQYMIHYTQYIII